MVRPNIFLISLNSVVEMALWPQGCSGFLSSDPQTVWGEKFEMDSRGVSRFFLNPIAVFMEHPMLVLTPPLSLARRWPMSVELS